MYFDEFKHQLPDIDPDETDDWLASLDQVVAEEGEVRARFLIYKLLKRARQLQVGLPPLTQTRYINTISPEQEPAFPGDEAMERRIRRLIRWNAVAMVLRANNRFSGIGGHLATYASAATPLRGRLQPLLPGQGRRRPGDQIFYQGHAAPGIYARAFLEGRLSEDQLDHFRRETGPGQGLSSYPHPRLMPDFWEFPTVSMGLGPISADLPGPLQPLPPQPRPARHLRIRASGRSSATARSDEPESLGALHVAAREGLDNLTFVVNCNLQRLDGPVRGNGKIIQELESAFRGAGWNVIKVIWAREWDDLLARDVDGLLVQQMNDTARRRVPEVLGRRRRLHPRALLRAGPASRQARRAPDRRRPGQAPPRRPRLPQGLRGVQGGHRAQAGAPTVILAHTVKGWTLGPGVEARNITHQAKKLNEAELRIFRDRLELPIPDDTLQGRAVLPPGSRLGGGRVPPRAPRGPRRPAAARGPSAPAAAGAGPGGRRGVRRRAARRPVSTTMVFARILRNLIRDPELGPRIVPIIPDEARTFGMDPLFKEVGIYSALGQRYEPVDSDLVLSYREATDGQVLEEGITEAGSMASFQAAGTSYASHGLPIIPFYIFYSMFGFQRTGDQMWAFGDARGRGFLMGATAGRTTLTGEGLQHDDGQTQILASTVPNLRAYDPAFAYELAAVVRDGIERMYGAEARGRLLLHHALQRELRRSRSGPRA